MQNLSLFETNSQLFTASNSLSFNFNDYTNLNLVRFSPLIETKSYTPITGCVLEHVLTTTNLTSCEKLYYLLADSLSQIRKNKGEARFCALPSEDWAEYLGCSRSLVFTMQQSLVKKGYFIINKDFDGIGRNNRNLITPTLPASIFNQLNEKYPDRVGDHTPYNCFVECKRSYLDRTKLFIKLNYNLLKIISSNKYTNPRQKIMWLGFYTRCYKNYMLQGKEGFNVDKYSYNDDSSFSFITSYKELADLYSCNTKHISKSIRALEELGFIKTQNIYIRKRCGGNDDCKIQERQDQSLWKITLSLPDECIAELEKVKNRSNLKLKNTKDELVITGNSIDPKLIKDYLILGGIKFNLNIEQSDVLKSAIIDGNDNGLGGASVNSNGNLDIVPPLPHIPYTESYIDSVMEELDECDVKNIKNKLAKSSELEDIDLLSNTTKTLSISSSLEELDEKIEKEDGIKFDPHVAKSGLLLNKDLLLKIKDIKSNLGAIPKVLFNDFLKRFRKNEPDENAGSKKEGVAKGKEFNIHSELIREKLKELPKEKADKARKFAYSLVSKGLANGYAASLSKHELAKQIIYHAATWKPTKLGSVSREKEIDTALSVAWKAIVNGKWQAPLELSKALVLEYEFRHHKQKYQKSGVMSYELKTLEIDTEKLLGKWCDLDGKIKSSVTLDFEKDKKSNGELCKPEGSYDYWLLQNNSQEAEYNIYGSNQISTLNIKATEYLQGFDNECYRLDYDYPELEECGEKRINRSNISLSHIPEEQKYLKVTPSDIRGDDSIRLDTTSGKEYYVRLKELEMNEEGEFVMTLKPVKAKVFLEYYLKGASLPKHSGDAALDGNNPLSIEPVEQEMNVRDLSLESSTQWGFAEFEDGFLKDFLQFTKKVE